MSIEEAGVEPQHLKFRLRLELTYRATVIVDADSSKTVDELQKLALRKFHQHEKESWRNQFRDRADIEAWSAPEVVIGSLEAEPPKKERGW
jgi:hypothetical protein